MTSVGDAINSVIQAKSDAVRQQIGISVTAKSLDVSKQQGEAVNQLLDAAASLSKAIGKGQNFDAVG